jgi:hypothetical protein
MSIVVTPISAAVSSGNPSAAANAGNLKYIPFPFRNGEKVLTVFTGNETFNVIETYLSIDRNIYNLKGLILRFFRIILPCAGFGLLILCFGYVINKKEQNKSILTIRLGGHAPPNNLRMQAI